MDIEAKITISIASDHAGYDLKQVLLAHLLEQGYEVINLGTDGTNSVDYPDFRTDSPKILEERNQTKVCWSADLGLGSV